MKKSFFWAFIACFVACLARAEEVTPAMAMAAADAWATRNVRFETGNNATNVITKCDTNAAQTVLWHQVSMAGGGCLIIAPVTEIEPVIMALDSDPGELPAAHPLRAILMGDIRRRLRFLKLYEEDPQPGSGRRLAAASGAQADEAESETENVAAERQEWGERQQAKWKGLLTPASSQSARSGRRLKAGVKEGVTDEDMPSDEIVVVKGFEKGGPITRWNQSGGIFDKYTPGNSVCGCVATAMGAMMQFFQVGSTEDTKIKPNQYNGACSYNGGPVPGGAYTKGGIYNWKGLPKSWGGEGDENASLELLGRVAYDAGVAVGMSWTKGASGAVEANIATAFTKYFGFHEVRYVDNPTQDQYAKLIYAQNRANAPVGMGIEKHSVVAAGYGIDNDGVERVRVFLGWGGKGDGWYALPYIDTKSTESGPSYLSKVVDGVITMIGYKDDKIVPVCGRLIPRINPPMTIGGTYYSPGNGNFHVFTNGFFGARVSASETRNSQAEIVCHTGGGKSGNVSIGSDPGKDSSNISSGAGICNWVPDPFLFPLLNSEVALSFADAREKSIASVKPILAFSGKWGEPATDAAWNYLYWRDSDADDATKEAFTNLYVILCTQYALSNLSESDGNPSIGLFDGKAISADANNIWSFHNGRLAHWSIGGSIYTNVEDQVDNDLREFYVTNSVDGVGFIVTNSVEELLAQDTELIDAFELNGRVPARFITGWGVTNYVETTLEKGHANFTVRATGASVTVSNLSATVSNEWYEALAEWMDPDCGTYTMSNSVLFVSVASQFATNAAGNIEFECLGCIYSWTNTNENVTGDDLAGIVTNDFEMVKDGMVVTTVTNGIYTIAWLWTPSKVKITTETANSEDWDDVVGAVDPGTGWFPVNTRVVFKAKPPDSSSGNSWYFLNWVAAPPNNLGADDMYTEFGDELALVVQRPVTIKALFECNTTFPDWGSFNLVVTNVCFRPSSSDPSSTEEEGNSKLLQLTMQMEEILSGSALTNGEIVATVAPNTLHNGTALENNATNVIPKLGISSMRLDAGSVTGIDGQSYVCCGWRVTRLVSVHNEKTDVWEDKEQVVDLVYSSDGYVLSLDDLLAEQPGLEINYALTPTVAGIRTGDTSRYNYKYPVGNGDTLTLTWLWKRGAGWGVTDAFDIQWNDKLNNLTYDFSTNLMTTAEMYARSLTVNEIAERVTTPIGWLPVVEEKGEFIVATLKLDEDALINAMNSCDLTVIPNADGTLTVQAAIVNALRGFWYVLYGSDDLATWVPVADGTYESGTPAEQGPAANPVGPVTLYITVTPGDTSAGVKRFYKVVSGATSTPLTTY